MAQKLIEIVVGAFKDDDAASAALSELKIAQDSERVEYSAAAVLRKDDAGKLDIKETNDPGAARGAVVGGLIGGVAGLLLGPLAIATAAAGAAFGALADKLHDAGLDDTKLKHLGEALQAGTGAVVVLTTAENSPPIVQLLKDAGADFVMDGLNQGTIERLKSMQ
jgi:uncharacterized membrane protein